MKKVKPISKSTIKEYTSTQKQIINRIDYIIKFLCKTFDSQFDSWAWADPDVGIDYSLKEKTDFWVKIYCLDVANIWTYLDKKGTICTFYPSDFCIPMKWLFNDFELNDFELEIIVGRKAYNKQKLDEKKNEEAEKLNRATIIKRAKSKLSKEELAALKEER